MFSITTPQKNIWNLQKFYSDSSISNISGIFVFNEKQNLELLGKAINAFIKKQEGIRLRFIERGKDIYQYVAVYEYIDIPIIHFVNMEEVRAYFKEDGFKVFSMTEHVMYRFYLFDTSNQCGIYVCFSHLVSDAWTLSLFCRKVMEYYRLLEQGLKIDETITSYMDYVRHEEEYKQSERYRKDTIYWNNRFSSKPIVSYIKPNCTKSKSVKSERLTKSINFDMTRRIREWCKKNNVSLAVTFEAVVFAYLYKINENSKEIVIGVPVLNRTTRFDKEIAGMFISTMPLGVTVSGEETICQLCNKISDSHRKMFRHQKYPYSYILENIRNKFDFFENLFDVMVSYQNAQIECDDSFKYHTEWFHNGYSEISLALHIDDRDKSGSLTINMDYQTDVFSNMEAEFLYERFYFILRQLIGNDTILINELSIIPENEYQKMIYDFNDTIVEYQKEKCIHELFAERVNFNPDKIALVFEDKQFTYKQLDEMSNSLAHHLRKIGIKPNDVVPIIARRSWHIIVAMLGILKAGGAYMPIDPTYPADRIKGMFSISNSNIALLYGYKGELSINKIHLDKFNYFSNIGYVDNINKSNDICYVIFTSGSTGEPKGAAICHKNVLNYCDNNDISNKIIKPDYRSIISVTNIVFDIFTTESILPLLNGITIYFANDDEIVSQLKLGKIIFNNKIDMIQTTPTKIRSYIFNKNNIHFLSVLKVIILGGETLPIDLLYELKKYTNAEIFNIYGPTETTVWATNKKVEDRDITIGKPIANTQIYILDKDKKPLPIGVAGELCISGDGVGKGYLNRPDLTAEKFIPNPFILDKMMYCSGDLARWRVDGEIEYLGRIDTQVKIRGLRIELGEIESVMNTWNGIKIVAVADKRDEKNRQYLVGYYTSDSEMDERMFRQHLSAKLPKYMVPNYFMRIPEMPMTASGKIDRKNLPMPVFGDSVKEYVAPRNNIEQTLCEIAAKVLHYEKVGINDDFFELGGDSLKAIEYTAEAFDKGVMFDLQTVFEYPTVAEISKYLSKKSKFSLEYVRKDFEKYEEILSVNRFENRFKPKYQSIGNVFLTGVTGYLGIHILDSLMRQERGKIYCLIRSNSLDDSYKRISQTLNYYFGGKYNEEIGRRIIPVVGDMVDERFSDSIPNDIETIIHTAANVKHFGDYSYFCSVNVNGTEYVLKLAKKLGAKFMFISTISVGGINLDKEGKGNVVFDESQFYIGQDLSNVYLRSKFEAERIVLDAKLAGYHCMIFRVGNLTNRYSDGKFQQNYQENAFLRRIKTLIDLKAYPSVISEDLIEFSPVDYTAKAIVRLIEYVDDRYTIFHVNNPRSLTYKNIAMMLSNSCYMIEAVEMERFLQKLSVHADNVYDSMKNELNERRLLENHARVITNSSFTEQLLKEIGFEWCDVTQEYIDKYVQYFDKLNYWKN